VCLNFFLPQLKIFQYFFYVVALLSIIVGAVGASLQYRIHRVLGFSSINFMGYFLTMFFCEPSYAFSANMYNFFVYGISILGFFSFLTRYITVQQKKLEVFSQFTHLGNSTKLGGWPLAIFLLSMGGVPPFPGFFSKILVLGGVASSHYFSFFLVASFMNIITYYYSLRVVKVLFFLELTKPNTIFIYLDSGLFRLVFIFLGFALFLFFGIFNLLFFFSNS
jgi:NADH-quinone oxidoreductase subunit N